VKRSCKPCFIGSQNRNNPPFAGALLSKEQQIKALGGK
jgi:hypothetical protein